MSIESFIKYIGKKDIDLSKYDINKYKIYCEPLAGSFNTGIKLAEQGFKGKIIFNDLDIGLYRLWTSVKEDWEKVYNYIIELKNLLSDCFSDEERKNIMYNWTQSSNKFKVAASEYLYNIFNSTYGFKFKLYGIDTKLENLKYDLFLVSELIRNTNIEFYNTNFTNILININSKDTFLLVDPPYPSFNYYKYDVDHELLKKALDAFKGSWLLIYNDCDYIRELYKGYNMDVVNPLKYREKYQELYISNIKEY